MITVYTDAHAAHDPPYEVYDQVLTVYPETAERAEKIIGAIRRDNLGKVISPRRFPLRHIYALHQPEYVDFVRRSSANLDKGEVRYPSHYISDTYAPLTSGTYAAARAAADAALTGAKLVANGERLVYTLCRPPGHHAAHHRMGGYCYFNNAAIAANYLSTNGRVAILDIDFHHGNGTQDMFYERDDVLYVSLHADPRQRYPYSSGFKREKGSGPGLGYTFNYPLPLGTTDRQYLRAVGIALQEIASFEPDFLVISAGFDTFAKDPIGGFALTLPVYRRVGSLIAGLAVPCLVVQEGGYNIDHLGDIVTGFLVGLNSR